jgi:hypothetical protein
MNKNIFKIIRAVIFGILLYLLITYAPIILLRALGINLGQPQAQIEDDPIYKNKQGKVVSIHEYNEMIAYDKAEKDELTSHAECKELYPNSNQGFQRNGCHRYITDQKKFSELKHIKQGDWASGKSTAQCQKEVKEYWDPIIQDRKERGEEDTSAFNEEFYDCQHYDTARISKYVYEPRTRLDDIVRKLEQGGTVTQEDNDIIAKDRLLVSDYPENDYTIRYFNQLDYFFKLAAKNTRAKQ